MGVENVIQTTTVKEDPQFAAYRQALLADANALVRQRSAEPVLPPAFQVAGLSPQEMQAMDLQKAGIGSYLPYLQSAQDLVGLGAQTFGQARGQLQSAQDQLALRGGARNELDSGVASIRQAGSARFDPSSVSQYQNPYQQYVGDAINRQFDNTLNQQQAQATSVGALSGSRRAVMEAELEGQRARAIGEAYAQDYGRAAQQAQQAFEAQQGRGMAAGQNLSNIGFQRADATSGLAGGIAGLGQQLSGLGGVQAGLGQQLQGMQAADVSQLMNLGTLQRGLGQSALDANRQSILQQQQYPYQQIQFLSDIYKGTPSNQQTVTATPTFSPSPFQQAAGLGIAGVSAYAGAKNAGLFGS